MRSQRSKDLPTVDKPSQIHELMAGLLVILVGAITLVTFFLMRAETQRLVRLDAQHAELTSELSAGTLAETALQVRRITQAAGALRQAAQAGLVDNEFLKDFQTTASPGVTFNTLAVDERGTVKIDGQGGTTQDVANFLATLRASEKVRAVELISTSLVEGQDGRRIQFSVAMKVQEG